MAETGCRIIKDELTPFLQQAKKALGGEGRKKMLKEINMQVLRDSTLLYKAEEYADENGNVKKWMTWNKNKGHIQPGTTKYKDGTWKLTHSAYIGAKAAISAGKFRKGEAYYIKGAHSQQLNLKTISGKRYSLSSKLNQDTGNLVNSIGSTGRGGINKTTSVFTELGTKVSYAEKQNNLRSLLSISLACFQKLYNIIFKNILGESKGVIK